MTIEEDRVHKLLRKIPFEEALTMYFDIQKNYTNEVYIEWLKETGWTWKEFNTAFVKHFKME